MSQHSVSVADPDLFLIASGFGCSKLQDFVQFRLDIFVQKNFNSSFLKKTDTTFYYQKRVKVNVSIV